MDHASLITDLSTRTLIINAIDAGEASITRTFVAGDEGELHTHYYHIPTLGAVVSEYNARTTGTRYWLW